MFHGINLKHFILIVCFFSSFFILDVSGKPLVRLRVVFLSEDIDKVDSQEMTEVRKDDFQPLFNIVFNRTVTYQMDTACTEFVSIDYESDEKGATVKEADGSVARVSLKQISHDLGCCDFLFDGWLPEATSVAESLVWPDKEKLEFNEAVNQMLFVSSEEVKIIALGDTARVFQKLDCIMHFAALMLAGIPAENHQVFYYNDHLYEPVYKELLQYFCKTDQDKINIERLVRSSFKRDLYRDIYSENQQKLGLCTVVDKTIQWFRARQVVVDEMSSADWLHAAHMISKNSADTIEWELEKRFGDYGKELASLFECITKDNVSISLSDSEDEDSVYGGAHSLRDAGIKELAVKQQISTLDESKIQSPFLEICQEGLEAKLVPGEIDVDHISKFPDVLRCQYQPIAYLGGAPFGPYTEGDLFLCRDKLNKDKEKEHVILKYFLENKVNPQVPGNSEGPVEIIQSGLVCSRFVTIHAHAWIGSRYFQILNYIPFKFYDVVKPGMPVSNEMFEYLAVQMFYGFKQLHNSGVVYRDFKPGNMGFNKKGEIVFFDTGGLWRSEVSSRVGLSGADGYSGEPGKGDFEIVEDDTVDQYAVVEPTPWMGTQNYMPEDKIDHYYQDRWALAVVLLEVRLGSSLDDMLKNHLLEDTAGYKMLKQARVGRPVDNYVQPLTDLYSAYGVSPLEGEYEMFTELFTCKGKYQKETSDMYDRLIFLQRVRQRIGELL